MSITGAKIICDSVSPAGQRLTTFEAVFPRIILAEVNTHRMLSRNSASSRAIPVEKMIQRVQEDPYVPTHWGKNQRGMRADEDLSEDKQVGARDYWRMSLREAVQGAVNLSNLGVHKQITNRLLEPFMWHMAIITATEWTNFFHLRDSKDAHPDFRDLAHAMRELHRKSEPRRLEYGQWHLPLVDEPITENGVPSVINARRCKISVGRCARVSYLTHDGKRDPQADIDLCDRLLVAGHLSPTEHVARPMTKDEMNHYSVDSLGLKPGLPVPFCGNFRGWVQFRKEIPHEEDILGARS